MRTGVELIAAERERQKSVEGWTLEHDDEHKAGDLALAAACYAIPEGAREGKAEGATASVRFDIQRFLWPWWQFNESGRGHHRIMAWWKPTPDDRVRELVKAGALIAAEIDRLQRPAAAEEAQHGE